jgi:hypothetical protein
MSSKLNIPKSSIELILKEELNLKKVNGFLVPHLLTEKQKENRII